MSHAAHPIHLLWLVLLLPLLSGTAAAAKDAPSCDDTPACQQLAAQGMEFFGAGRYREAEQSFAQAYAQRADPALLYNLGRAVHKAGRPREAAAYYQRFLDAGAAGDGEQRRKAEEYLSQAQKEATAALAAPPQPQPSSKSSGVPLYRKPWLWAIVGVAVAGIAVGLGVGLAAHRPDLSDAIVARPFGN